MKKALLPCFFFLWACQEVPEGSDTKTKILGNTLLPQISLDCTESDQSVRLKSNTDETPIKLRIETSGQENIIHFNFVDGMNPSERFRYIPKDTHLIVSPSCFGNQGKVQCSAHFPHQIQENAHITMDQKGTKWSVSMVVASFYHTFFDCEQ